MSLFHHTNVLTKQHLKEKLVGKGWKSKLLSLNQKTIIHESFTSKKPFKMLHFYSYNGNITLTHFMILDV